MKHTQKVKLAIKMAKRGATNIFTSKSWLNRRLFIFMKERARCKAN